MSKNHLTEGKVCAAAALQTRVFGVRRAAANEGIFIPHLVLYVLRSNCPTLPVKLDYPFAHRRAVARSRHFRRITVRLFDFSRRLGDTRDQCYYPRPSLDDLLQTPGTRQRPDATTGKSLIRGGQRCIANGDAQSGYRRHVDSTPIREGAGQHHSARSCKAEQPAAVSAGAMLGYVGRQRAGQRRQEVCVADCVPLSSHHRQSQQADHRAGVGAQPGARDNEQACSATVRCLVHASTPGIATAVAKDAYHRSSTVRYRIIPATNRCAQAWTRTTQNLRDQNDAQGNPEFAGNRSQADTLWQGTAGSSAHRGGNGTLSQRDAGARGMVRILRCGQTALVKSTSAAGDRNGFACRGDTISVCAPLGHRTLVSQPEALVWREQLVAAETHCAGAMDAGSLDGVDTGSVIESGCGRIFPYRCRGAVARQTTTDRRSGSAVATNGIYRTFFQRQFQPEVLNIHFPQTARRPKITDVAALSAANGMSFVRITPSCVSFG